MENKDYTNISVLITAYLTGEASHDEIRMLETWITESDDNLARFREFKNIWEVSGELPVSTGKALEKLMYRIDSRDNKPTLLVFMQRAAAALFIPLLFTVLWLAFGNNPKHAKENITYTKTIAAFGSYTYFVLPDGSKVWLNSGGSLQYPDHFLNGIRNVDLSGEAFFEVSSDSLNPFMVRTQSFTVKATGTRFNIMACKDAPAPTVTLVEGKVTVQKTHPDNRISVISRLRPNDHMIYDTISGKVSIENGDTYKHIAWKDGKLVFRGDLISEVAKRISLQYNVDIEIEGDKIQHYRFRASFENESLDELLRLLKISSPIDYREVKPDLLPDSAFSRRKIILFSTEE